jgi:hypothetical protein
MCLHTLYQSVVRFLCASDAMWSHQRRSCTHGYRLFCTMTAVVNINSSNPIYTTFHLFFHHYTINLIPLYSSSVQLWRPCQLRVQKTLKNQIIPIFSPLKYPGGLKLKCQFRQLDGHKRKWYKRILVSTLERHKGPTRRNIDQKSRFGFRCQASTRRQIKNVHASAPGRQT